VWGSAAAPNENESHYRPLDANDSHLEIDQAWQGKPIVPVNFADLFHYTFSLNLLLLLRWTGTQKDAKLIQNNTCTFRSIC
jgi:hypothetical protein